MNTFLDYIDSTKKEYKYTIKIATPVMSADMKGVLEGCLQKYHLNTMSAFKETPLQESPLDFPQLKNTKVFISDITMSYPATPDFLRKYVSSYLGITEGQIAVYTENDPRHCLTDEAVEKADPNYQPDLNLSEPMKFEAEPAYGEAYNSGFLKELAAHAAEQKSEPITNTLIPAQKVEAPAASPDEKVTTNNTPVLGINPKIDKYFMSGQ